MFDPPIYVNCRDRLTPLLDLLEWLESAGHARIVLLDNCSTYEPLLDYYQVTVHDVCYLPGNFGSRSIWAGYIELDDWFVFTDPDVIPISDCPHDAVERMRQVLDRHPEHQKCGLGLYLDDLPAGFDAGILAWEKSLLQPGSSWKGMIEPGVYDSLIDTTFALHRPGTPHQLPGIRLGYPYQARHVSWYSAGYTTDAGLSDEDAYYLEHANKGPLGSSWNVTTSDLMNLRLDQ